jgi:glycosyltransferase involved in cell wall biosynthesis
VKVLAVTNMYPSVAEPWFGCFVKDQMDAVRKAGVEVDVLAFDGRTAKQAYARAVAAVRQRVRSDKFDVVHAHYGLTGAVASMQRWAPVVTTIWGSDAGYVRWQGRVSWAVARLTTPIFVSQHNAQALGLPGARVISSGVDTAFFSPVDPVEARQALGFGNGLYILFPGRRDIRRKRADLFDAACEILREQWPDLQTLALQGYSREETRLLLSAVDVVLMTSDWEGSPVAIKEALSCRTRVVSVRVGDVPEVIRALPGCAVADRRPTALAEAVSRALDTPATPKLRERALQYDQAIVAEQVVSTYTSVTRSA